MMNSVKKMDTTTLPVKRLLDNNNSLDISNKKSKVSPIDDQGKDEDDIPSSNINKRPDKSADNLFSSLRKELGLVKLLFEECNRNPQVEERRLRSIKRDIEKCCKELENKETQVKELDSKRNILDGRVKEFESKKCEFETILKNREKEFEEKVKEFLSKEEKFQSKEKVFEAKEKTFEGKVKEFLSKEEKFLSKEKVFEAKEKAFEGKVKEYEEEIKGKLKEYLSKEEEIIGQVQVFEAKEEEFKLKKQQFENEVADILNFVKDNFKALELIENQLEVRINDFESKLNNSGGQLKDLELTKKQYDEEKEFDTSYMDDQLCDTIDGESAESEILDNLRESSDPAKMILDIIVNPSIPLPKKGDKAVIIDESRIYLLEQLMRISPNIKSCVSDEALKLAHELKASMKENTENSLEVLGFLLILSIYGLRVYFNEDEVLKLFASVAEYKIAGELFRTLGFANKVSDFVEHLIRRKEFDSTLHITWLRSFCTRKI